MTEIIHKKLTGTVMSDKMDKTIVVEVTRLFAHPKYKKYVKMSQHYKAHDPENQYHTGDRVVIQESRPMSKGKRWIVIEKKMDVKAEAQNKELAAEN